MAPQAGSNIQMTLRNGVDLTNIEAKRRGPAIAARLSGRAELFKERLDRDRLKDAGEVPPDIQRWMVKHEITKQKAIDAWLDLTPPRPDPAGTQVVAETQRFREAAARDRLRAEAKQTYVGAPAGLEAHVNAIDCQTHNCCDE